VIERGTAGRTSALTDWQLMDVTTMWACLQDHDTTNHWKQVAGWRKVCDLAREHLSRLQQYRHGLATAWPPETNDAARTYIHELDQLINKVQRTHDAASTNYTTLSAATQAISTTRTELKKIHDAYTTKLQEKQTYDATLNDPKAAIGSRVPDRPITNADLEQLNIQARGIMYGLSGELQQAQTMLQKPPPARSTRDPGNTDIYGRSTAVPLIPPIVSFPLAPTARPPALNPHSSSVQPVQSLTTPNAGPVLGGAGIGVAPPPTSPGLPTTQPPASPNSPPPVGGLPALPIGSTRTGTSGPSGWPIVGSPSSGNQARSTPSGVGGPMPPSGLIGGHPAMGLGQPGPGNNQPRRVNPAGGIIGGAGTAPAGSAGSRPSVGRGIGSHGIAPIGGTPSSGRGTSDIGSTRPALGQQELANEEIDRWDPDHPWQTNQGVSPVVRPPDDEGPFDPGPAIGLNR